MPYNYMHKDIMTYDNKTFILVFYITNLMAAPEKPHYKLIVPSTHTLNLTRNITFVVVFSVRNL